MTEIMDKPPVDPLSSYPKVRRIIEVLYTERAKQVNSAKKRFGASTELAEKAFYETVAYVLAHLPDDNLLKLVSDDSPEALAELHKVLFSIFWIRFRGFIFDEYRRSKKAGVVFAGGPTVAAPALPDSSLALNRKLGLDVESALMGGPEGRERVAQTLDRVANLDADESALLRFLMEHPEKNQQDFDGGRTPVRITLLKQRLRAKLYAALEVDLFTFFRREN